jgi:hypothetical protein
MSSHAVAERRTTRWEIVNAKLQEPEGSSQQRNSSGSGRDSAGRDTALVLRLRRRTRGVWTKARCAVEWGEWQRATLARRRRLVPFATSMTDRVNLWEGEEWT